LVCIKDHSLASLRCIGGLHSVVELVLELA
jgi:hypothetical protein